MARPDCTKCGGTGWKIIEGDREVSPSIARVPKFSSDDSMRAFDPPRAAIACECVEAEQSARARDRARIPVRYEHCDFASFETDVYEDTVDGESYNQNLARGKLVVEGFTRDFPSSGDVGLLLLGSVGVGKTHLAVAAAKQLIVRGHQVLFCDYRELLKEIQGSYNPTNQATEAGVLEPVLDAEILILDDLGASKPSNWALETIGHILTSRYNEKRTTILTANYLDDSTYKPIVQPSSLDSRLNSQLASTQNDLNSLDTANQPPDPNDLFAARREGRPTGSSRENRASFRLPNGESLPSNREDTLTERIGARIRSRLYEMCRTVLIHAPDFRKRVRNANNRPDFTANASPSGARSPRIHH